VRDPVRCIFNTPWLYGIIMAEQRSFNILLVEDDQLAQIGAKFVLERLGNSVDVADSGAVALYLLQQKNYDLVFLDLGLGDMDGSAVLQKIRQDKDNQVLQKMPVIALTAHTQSSFRQAAMAAGFNDYITKPLTREACKKLFDKFLR
jgi:CheY-like chemotaxis protein